MNESQKKALESVEELQRMLDENYPVTKKKTRGPDPKVEERKNWLIKTAHEILSEHRPRRMTLRQIFYQMVSRDKDFSNTTQNYHFLMEAMVIGRKDDRIPWDWMEDRTRLPRHVSMWEDLPDYLSGTIYRYRRDIWINQPRRVEVWLEKETLAGIFLEVLKPLGVTLTVGHGWDSWCSIYDFSERIGDDGLLLYFSDFDPCGEGMPKSFTERLEETFYCTPEIRKVALTLDQVRQYNLPPMMCKESDKLTEAHVAKYGDVAVELDALKPEELSKIVHESICSAIDMDAFLKTQRKEKGEIKKLTKLIKGITTKRKR